MSKTYTLTPEQLSTFTEAFQIFDKSNSGLLPFAELPLLLMSIGQNPTNNQIHKILAYYDTEDSHSFNLDVFLTICESPFLLDFMKEDSILEVFRQFDQNANQTLSVAQLRAIVQVYGDKLSNEDADSFIDFALSKCDSNKTGVINYELLVRELMERDPGVQWSS